ncbi:MAG: hypothetical protein JW837_14095 [Sedimentisphaerales bacterium]|nr:hypothetical protein [Sedimentisphaerales bacterium]
MAIELSGEQIKRQDFVDNAVFNLIQNINPSSKELSWDIEMIGEIRDDIRQWLVERLGICNEMSFYPYIKE